MAKGVKSTEDALARSELRKFGLILASGILIIFGLLFPLLREGQIQLTSWPWLLSLALVTVSLIAPAALGPLSRAWLFLGHILGYINTRIILGIIFLVLFTPCALVLKLLKKDPMHREIDPQRNSYRVDSNQPKIENLNRPY